MLKYAVKSVEKPDWDKIEKAPIDKFIWLTEYCPVSFGQLAFVEGEGLHVRLTCFEASPKAVYSGFYGPVYKDSCLEFFASFGDSDKYMNCEMNSAGAALIGIGTGRHGRHRIDEYIDVPKITASCTGESWSVETVFTIDDIEKLFKIRIGVGTIFRGNLYKCGDETETEHYGTWNLVNSEKPDFHRPESFGLFEIKNQKVKNTCVKLM